MIKHADPSSPSGFRFELTAEEMAAGFDEAHYPGPITGTITTADGTAYDVTEDCIPIRSKHRGELFLGIHKAHHAAGRFTDVPIPDDNYGVPQG